MSLPVVSRGDNRPVLRYFITTSSPLGVSTFNQRRRGWFLLLEGCLTVLPGLDLLTASRDVCGPALWLLYSCVLLTA